MIITPHNNGLLVFQGTSLGDILEIGRVFVETGRPVRNVVEREKGY